LLSFHAPVLMGRNTSGEPAITSGAIPGRPPWPLCYQLILSH
jgi:hypothetical protein